MKDKKRLDILLVEKRLVETREKARALIMEGMVYVNGEKITKPGTKFLIDNKIFIKENLKYVSRGGLKLEKAISEFNINIKDKICLDIGASTGGFTDCLLQNEAKKIYAVDVGYGQLHWKIRNNSKVVVIERCNFRYITKDKLPEVIDLITIDVSFISLKKIIPKALEFLKKQGEIIALIKPQFEAGKNNVEKGGIVKNPEIHKQVINNLCLFFQQLNLQVINIIESPIKGQKGNKEFLIYLKYLKGE
jgi:23S rRNA (cytidine1920-2'-O)/16S rRNA (cytidine1409-2'-O)-methyltransferase